MSWLFSRALVEDCLVPTYSAYSRDAVLSWIGEGDAYLLDDRTKELYPRFQFGMTFLPLTVDPGFLKLISSLEVFLAKHSVTRQGGVILPSIFGRKCSVSSAKLNQPTFLQRTSPERPSKQPQKIVPVWVTKPKCFPLVRKTWVQTMYGKDFGYLHTPTTKANYAAHSMQKHSGCRNYVKVFGRPHPIFQEWLMGWPEGWTDTKPLEMGKFQLWQRQLCGHLHFIREILW